MDKVCVLSHYPLLHYNPKISFVLLNTLSSSVGSNSGSVSGRWQWLENVKAKFWSSLSLLYYTEHRRFVSSAVYSLVEAYLEDSILHLFFVCHASTVRHTFLLSNFWETPVSLAQHHLKSILVLNVIVTEMHHIESSVANALCFCSKMTSERVLHSIYRVAFYFLMWVGLQYGLWQKKKKTICLYGFWGQEMGPRPPFQAN